MSTFGVFWDEPWFWLLLLALPVMVWRIWSRRGRGRVPVPRGAAFVAVSSVRAALWWLPDALRVLALLALIATLARPQVAGAETVSGEGVDIMLAFDLSASMNGIDMPQRQLEETLQNGDLPRNRFEVARDILEQFVVERNRAAHDRIGLVVFGPEAWLKYPLTHDHASIVRTLEDLVLDDGHQDRSGRCTNGCTIPGNGTAIGDALGRAYNQLRRSQGSQDKIVILITDGKEEGGTLKAQAIARHIRDLPPEERVRVYTFLVGGKRGGEVWLPVQRITGWKKGDRLPMYDHPPRPFETDPELLQEIAASTGGKYYESYSEEKFKEDITDLKRTAFESNLERQKADVFQWPLLVGLVLLLAEHALRFTLFRGVV
ncbi:MAG: VWA domain-containing protein [Myxococcota bacterium]